MNRPLVIDAFPFAGTPTEMLLLECRLTELYDAVDHFVIVEATVDHQDHPKPLHYLEQECQFKPWADKIIYVVADRLPTLRDDPGAWGREVAQREYIAVGLHELAVANDDIILQSDLDEIPTAVAARNVRPPKGVFCSFAQKGHFWAVDWLYPHWWYGTVAARAGSITTFGDMRNTRNYPPSIPNAGWHFSWLGGPQAWTQKVGAFCHPEVESRLVNGGAERFWREGVHVDFKTMDPVEIDGTYPRWMQNPDNVPDSWRRPR